MLYFNLYLSMIDSDLVKHLIDQFYMRGRVANSSNQKNGSLKHSLDSVNRTIVQFQNIHPSAELQELEKEFKITLTDYDRDIQEELKYILIKLLEYPSSHQAQGHQQANRLGLYDINNKQSEEGESHINLNQGYTKAFCKDCGLALQPQQIPLCAILDSFPKMGIAAYLYFQNIKNLMVLLFLLGCFYSSYALYTNINEPSYSIAFENHVKKLSFASTIQNLTTNNSLYDAMFIEGWLITGGVCLWWVMLFIMKKAALKQERMVDDETVTAADFSIMLQHIPLTLTKGQLQKELNSYYELLKDMKNIHGKENLRPFKIRKFCKATPFYFLDEEAIKQKILKLEDQMSDLREKISQLIQEVKDIQKFKTPPEDRKKIYKQYTKLNDQRNQCEKQLKNLYKNFHYQENTGLTTAAFVVFEYSESANTIQISNPHNFGARLRYYLSCCQSGLYFLSHLGVKTFRAPQPEDIIWQNIGIPDCSIRLRKMLTYFVTLLLLGTSFGIVYGLTLLQMTYKSAILSIASSLSITFINILIKIAIRALTVYQSDITSTQRQVGLAVKSIFAQLINSTLVPVITNIYIEKNIYEVDGLIYDVYYLSLTAALLPPILKILDISFRIKQITVCYYNNSPYAKLALSQKELNNIYELPQFQLGLQYIYFIDLFYFTCFYVFVQPCIVIFSLIGFSLMYWLQKHTLLSRSKRPTPSSAVLNQVIGQLVGFCPCMLSIGQFAWFNLVREDYHDFSSGIYISHLTAIGCSAMFFLLPFNAIFNAFCSIPDDEDLVYQQVRQRITSQYDLLNPATADQALEEFFEVNKKPKKGDYGLKEKPIRPQEKQKKALVVKVARKSNNITQENMLQMDYQTDLIVDSSIQNNTFMEKYQPSRPRKQRIRKQTSVEPRKPIIQQGLSGYHAGALKPRQTENSPYKDLKF